MLKCAFKTHPIENKLWRCIKGLPVELPQILASVASKGRPSCYPKSLVCLFLGVQELPLLLHLITAREKESRILHSPSTLFFQRSIGSRGTLSCIRRRPRNTESKYVLALLPRCLELLNIDYVKTRQQQDTGRQTVKGCHFSARRQLPVQSLRMMLKYTLQGRKRVRKKNLSQDKL